MTWISEARSDQAKVLTLVIGSMLTFAPETTEPMISRSAAAATSTRPMPEVAQPVA